MFVEMSNVVVEMHFRCRKTRFYKHFSGNILVQYLAHLCCLKTVIDNIAGDVVPQKDVHN